MGLDLRWPIGLMFSLIGALLVVYGLVTNSNQEIYARSLGLNVVAEGVETQAQMEFLREHHCDEIQGFWLSSPLDAHRCLAFIRNWSPAATVAG